MQMQLVRWVCVVTVLIHTVFASQDEESNDITQDETEILNDKTVKKLKDTAFKLKRSIQYLKVDKLISELGDKAKRYRFILEKVPVLGMVLDSLDLVFGIMQTFPAAESPLMKKIRTSFDEINKKLDTITSDLKDTGNLIKLATQKAVYIRAENRILTAYKNSEVYANELQQVTCKEKTDCTKKKSLIAERYLSRFDVENDVNMILRGAISNSVFGQSLLVLTKEITYCDIKKIQSTTSLVAGLVTKGYVVMMLHKYLTNPSFDKEQYKAEFQRQLVLLERKKDSLSRSCFDSIDRYIRSDFRTRGRKYFLQNNVETANKLLSEYLLGKYFWIRLYVITVSQPKDKVCESVKPTLSTSHRLMQDLSVIDDDKKIYTFLLFGSFTDANIAPFERELFKKAIVQKELVDAIGWWFKIVSNNGLFDDFFETLKPKASLFMRMCQKIVVSYSTTDGKVHQYSKHSGGEYNAHDVDVTDLMYDSGTVMSVLALMQSPDDQVRRCSRDCGFNGECSFLPYSKQMICYCRDEFYGDNCQSNIVKKKTIAAYNKLLAATVLHIPTRTDLKAQLEIAQRRLKSNVETADSRMQMLSGQIGRMTSNMFGEINTRQEWQGLVTQYSEILQDMKYYHYVLGNDDSSHLGHDKFSKMELKTLAKQIIIPDKLEKYLQMVNYLFVGRDGTPLVSHRSLIFEEMKRHKSHACSTEYKQILDHAYELLVSLQMQGYETWLKAHDVLNKDPSHMSIDYENIVRKQKNFFDRYTCKVAIPHSAHLENCLGGYYIYNGMKNNVSCKHAYYLSSKCCFIYFIITTTKPLP